MLTSQRRLVLLVLFLAVLSPAVFAQTLLDVVPVGSAPKKAVVNTLTNKIYVGNSTGQSVSVIDGVTDQATTVPLQQIDVAALAIDPSTNKIYVTDDASTGFSVIDGATLAVTNLTIGGSATSLAINGITNTIYVPSPFGTLTIIDGASLTMRTLPIAGDSVAVNSITNQIYVASSTDNTVTVINGATLATATITLGTPTYALAVNPLTNKIYAIQVPFFGGNVLTVIDGATLGFTTVTVGQYPDAVAINQQTNKIYVAAQDGTVSVVDGATNGVTMVTIGGEPFDLAVNPATNQIYVAGAESHSVTVIDGATLAFKVLSIGQDPVAIAANSVTNRVYAVDYAADNALVIGGAGPTALQFLPATPCRLVDTRQTGNPIQGGTFQSFTLPQLGNCQIPSNEAFSLNVTVVPRGPLGYLTIWPDGTNMPLVSTMNSPDGRIKANAAIVPAGTLGAVDVYASDTTDVILDIDGYFAPANAQSSQFYPVTPCRVVDTRHGLGDLAGPYLKAGVARDFPLLESPCVAPGVNPQAYSLNVTVVPHTVGQPLGYLTVWPKGQQQPVVSTLNNPTATVVANAAIVPAGLGGAISAFAYNDTDLIIDIDGYYGATGRSGLSFYPATPCRVLDTRGNNGQPFSGELTVNVEGSPCAPPGSAQAYVLNATVVPSGSLGYLTLWPNGQQQPGVSTLNAYDGLTTSNMAIVPTADGDIDAYASGLTQLILDISGYFAP